MAELFSDSDSELNITINKDYAESYNNWRQKEEFQKLKDRHGEVDLKKLEDDEDESSTSDEEDENAKELTHEIEKEFFRTLSCLKKHDPRIYDEKVKFFDAVSTGKEQHASSGVKIKKEKDDKPLLLRDYERKLIVEREGKLSDDEEDSKPINRPYSPTPVEEQKAIKDSFKNILENSDGEEKEDGDWGGIFWQRKKTKEDWTTKKNITVNG